MGRNETANEKKPEQINKTRKRRENRKWRGGKKEKDNLEREDDVPEGC